MHFRKLILENSDRYIQCTNRKEKSGIISSIYVQITSGYRGRFLEASDSKPGSSDESYRELWREVNEIEAKKKISQSLRDEKKRQQRSTTIETSAETCVTVEDSILSRRRKRPRLTDSREQSSMQTTSSSSQGKQMSSSTSPVLPSNVSAAPPPLYATAAAAPPLLNNNFTLPPLTATTISDALSGMSTMTGFSNSNTMSAMGSNNIQNIFPWSLHSSLNNYYLPTTAQLSDFATLPSLSAAPEITSATSSNSRNSQIEALSLSRSIYGSKR